MTTEAQALAATATEGTVETAADSILKKMEAQSAEREAPKPAPVQSAEIAAAPDAQEMPVQETADAVDPTEGTDTGQEPTIDAPAGFTADEKEWFKTLEPARQESILRQYKATQAAEARRQNEYQAELRRVQQEAEQAATMRQQFEVALGQYKTPLQAEFERRFPDIVQGQIDPVTLARTDPGRFQELQAFQMRFNEVAQTENQLAQMREQEEAANLQRFRQTENKRLAEMVGLKTAEEFSKFDAEVSDYMLKQGAPPEVIVKMPAEYHLTAWKAMQWDKAKAAQNAPKTAAPAQGAAPQALMRQPPKMLKPSNGNAGNKPSDDQYTAARNKARKTGAVEDAAGAIRALMARNMEARR